MNIVIRAIECFVMAIFYGLLPVAIGFALGYITRRKQCMDKHEYLKTLILRLFDEGKISDFEKNLLLTAVDELKEQEDKA